MITLVTGGSGSGKSAYAEEVLTGFGNFPRIYIATMYPFDEESKKRIKRHRKMRAEKNFNTIECYTGLRNLELPEGCCVLLECMSNLVANEMFQEDGAKDDTVPEILEGISEIEKQAKELVIVTNEIFQMESTMMKRQNDIRVILEKLIRAGKACKNGDRSGLWNTG